MKTPSTDPETAITHWYHHEYGKLVSFLTRFLGVSYLREAEDIAQETFMKATMHWQYGMPPNPQAWLYITAKNIARNFFKRQQYQLRYKTEVSESTNEAIEAIQNAGSPYTTDEQLTMMFVCCHPALSSDTQIALMLKILCGFSIAEIANAFFVAKETIHKRLVRGRKKLRALQLRFELPKHPEEALDTIVKTIYFLFNEGYYPSEKNKIIRSELCFEAIRLVEIMISESAVPTHSDSHALLSLMYLNSARFEARLAKDGEVIVLKDQDRSLWNRALSSKGIEHLNMAMTHQQISKYHILAAISAHHTVAPTYSATNWQEILSLYDALVLIEDSPIIQLNRSVALAEAEDAEAAITVLEELDLTSTIGGYYLFHATLGTLYTELGQTDKAILAYQNALRLTTNVRDKTVLKKKVAKLVPK